MADQKVPYQLLKKVMATCAAAEYRDISLAVTKKELPANNGEG
jgi:biopolymer transport protein ExbD